MTTFQAIDLRSDTITNPSDAMREAIASAPVGDNCYGDDLSVLALEHEIAAIMGKEAALFMPSGTMSNQVALRVLTQPGDEVICDATYHVSFFESAQSSQLAGVCLGTINSERGIISVDDIQAQIESKPRGSLYAQASLVWLENTISCTGGSIFPLAQMQQIVDFCHGSGMKIHLDGARLFNASVASGIPLSQYAACADTITVCFSKGLGAPFGAALVGTSHDIERARRFRMWYGGALHQAGMMAAGALYGLRHNMERLKEDHHNASYFASILSHAEGVALATPIPETNMVYFATPFPASEIAAECAARGVRLFPWTHSLLRAVFHLNVSRTEVARAASIISQVVAEKLTLLERPMSSSNPETRGWWTWQSHQLLQ